MSGSFHVLPVVGDSRAERAGSLTPFTHASPGASKPSEHRDCVPDTSARGPAWSASGPRGDRAGWTGQARSLAEPAMADVAAGAWPIEPWRLLGRDPYGGLRSHRVGQVRSGQIEPEFSRRSPPVRLRRALTACPWGSRRAE